MKMIEGDSLAIGFCINQIIRTKIETSFLLYYSGISNLFSIVNIFQGKEPQPRPLGEDHGVVVFQYKPSNQGNYFSRSVPGRDNEIGHDYQTISYNNGNPLYCHCSLFIIHTSLLPVGFPQLF